MRKDWIAGALTVCLLLTGCGTGAENTAEAARSSMQTNTEEPVSREIFAMDTYMIITAYGENGQEAVDAAEQEIDRLDALLSTGSADSEISRLNAAGTAQLSEDSAELVSRALEINRGTGGAFDITVYPLMQAWGFTDEAYQVPSDSTIAALLEHTGSDQLDWDDDSNTLTLGDGQAVDLGGIAKGYTSGRIMELFDEYGVQSGLVSLGGNVHVHGTKPDGDKWRVGVQDPENSENVVGVLEVTDCAVITSGGYERYFEQNGTTYHHIIDPSTGKPADSGLSSVTIVSADGTLADGLSTALFVMGADKAAEYWRQHADEFDAVLIADDGSISVTEGIADAFSSDQSFEIISRK